MTRIARLLSLAIASFTATVLPTASHAQAQPRHYDCTKAGNANKAVCKAAANDTAAAAPVPTPAATSRPTAPQPHVATPAAIPRNGSPTARCRDGSFSYSAHRSGTCSHHGGGASWS